MVQANVERNNPSLVIAVEGHGPSGDYTVEYLEAIPGRGRYEFPYPEGMDEPSTSIVEAIAWLKNVESRELGALPEHLDPNALNELLVSVSRRGECGSLDEGAELPRVRFAYEGFVVTVTPGRFTLQEG